MTTTEKNNFKPTEAELAVIEGQIDSLRQKARMSKNKAKESFEKQLQAVEDQYELVKARMAKASRQVEVATDELNDGVAEAWMKLKKSFSKASQSLH